MSQATAIQDRKPSAGGVNATFLWIEIKRMLRNRRTVMFTVLMPAIFFFVFGLSNKNQHLPNGHSYGQYILISLTVYAAMTAATGAGSQVAVERAQGWSRQLRLTPLLPGAYIAVKAAAALTLSLVAVVAQFIIGAIAGVTMDVQTWMTAGIVALCWPSWPCWEGSSCRSRSWGIRLGRSPSSLPPTGSANWPAAPSPASSMPCGS